MSENYKIENAKYEIEGVNDKKSDLESVEGKNGENYQMRMRGGGGKGRCEGGGARANVKFDYLEMGVCGIRLHQLTYARWQGERHFFFLFLFYF